MNKGFFHIRGYNVSGGNIIFNVYPISSLLIGLFRPKDLIEKYSCDEELVKSIENILCRNLGYDQELIHNARIGKPSFGGKEARIPIESRTEKNKYHIVGLDNIIKKNVPISDIFNSGKNLIYRCACGRGSYIDNLCSVSYDVARKYGFSKDEWEKYYRENKMYVNIACPHIIRAISYLPEIGYSNYFLFEISLMPKLLRKWEEKLTKLEKIKQKSKNNKKITLDDIDKCCRSLAKKYLKINEYTKIIRNLNLLEKKMYDFPKGLYEF
ncbi:MAG: hypothetical protein J7J93_01920 [Candidatus Aenigmarchaeota archaeon]|nr:hypothetical protein [Candidatus Aenigmarchaeota archaeon]